jgi:prepilin-type N-terminal cleavage/methylation domain-containing protein
MLKFVEKEYGFTLVEVVITIIIAGILAAVSLRTISKMAEIAKIEETKKELEAIEFAIVGNPKFYNDDTRSDFGFVGDVGSLPPNLDALFTKPEGYATWRGPYIDKDYEQNLDDFKQDAWGSDYSYSGGISIISSGSGTDIIRTIGETPSDFISNGINGVVLDLDGTPPGPSYRDSIIIMLTIPDGIGGISNVNTSVDLSGYFSFNSIPIGNHNLTIIYTPTADTLKRFVTVLPKSRLYGEYFLSENVWTNSDGS